MDFLRWFYNPLKMEQGDRLWGTEQRTSGDGSAQVRIHWFTRREVEEDAVAAGFNVILASSVAAVRRNPAQTCRKTHNHGWLVYVLQKPAS
jgi:hypothetical protein